MAENGEGIMKIICVNCPQFLKKLIGKIIRN